MATEVPVVLRIFAEQAPSVNNVLADAKKRFQDLAGEIASVSRAASVLAGGMTVALGGVVAAVVRTAGQFEQLQAKLTSVLGSSEAAAKAFGRALEFAASTPFDVQGIVRANVTIAAFGQSIERVLPLATNLAAAFGTELNYTAIVLGKAFSGSLEGFESLRNQFGITNIVLKKYGAELNKAGGIAVLTAGQMEKARSALQRIIETRFGDATARQSQTLFGALSNLGDAIQRTAAAFGKELIPAVTAVTRTLTGIIEVFERMDPGMRQAVVYGTLLATGFAAVATAAAAMTAVFSSAVGGVVAFGTSLAAALGAWAEAAGTAGLAAGAAALEGVGVAGGVAAGGLGAAAAAAPAAATGLGAIAAAAVALINPVTIVVTVFGVLLKATADWEQRSIAAGKAIEEQTRQLIEGKQALKDHLDLVEQVTNSQGKLVSQAGSMSQLSEALRVAFENVTPGQYLENLRNAGVTLDGLRKQQELAKGSTEELRQRVDILSRALDILQNREQSGAFAWITPADLETLADASKLLGGVKLDVDNVGGALVTARQAFGEFLKANLGISTMMAKMQELVPAFEAVSGKAAGLERYLRFATKPDDVQALDSAMGVLGTSITEIEGDLAKLKVPIGSIAELQTRLLTADDAEAKAITSLLQLYEARENIEKKRVSLGDKAIQDRIRAEESAIERRTILQGESKRAEIQIYQELLGVVRAGSSEELQLLRKIADRKQALKREEVATAKQGLDALVSSSNEGLEELRATGNASANETATALEGVLAKLSDWEQKNQNLLAQAPKLAQEFRNVQAGFQKRLDTANLEQPKELLRDSITAAKEFGTVAVTNEEKLRAAIQGRQLLERLAASGQITTLNEKRALQAEINRLTKEEANLQHQVTKEMEAQERQTAAVRREGLGQELEVLKAQQRREGNSPFRRSQIAELEKKILAQKVEAIRDQEKAEVEGGATAEQARERAELRMTALKREETLRRIQLEEEQTRSVEAEAQKQLDILNRFAQNRFGGPNSPLQSIEEMAAGSNLFGASFSLGPSFSLASKARGALGPPPASLSGTQAQVDQDIAQGEGRPRAGAGGRGAGFGAGAEAAATGAGAADVAGNTTINHYSLGVQGYPINSPEVEQSVRTIVDKILVDKGYEGAT